MLLNLMTHPGTITFGAKRALPQAATSENTRTKADATIKTSTPQVPQAKPYILVLDHGTTGIRACLMDRQGQFVAKGYKAFRQIKPKPGWVEHNPNTLWKTTRQVIEEAFQQAGASWKSVHSVALTNQRETTILWDAKTGKPIHNAIVWQCRRTTEACEALKAADPANSTRVQDKTGLVIDPYFSATKIKWLLDNVPQAKKLLTQGRLRFGTVDSWILWHLSGGKAHLTDTTNASRTGLYNIHTRQWDPDLLALYGIPAGILPQVVGSGEPATAIDPTLAQGETGIPVAGIIGDQQAALFGQKCWAPGEVKSTFGTGAFLVMNLGDTPVKSQNGLLTTLAAKATGQPAYALEGSIFSAGTIIEWMKNLKLFRSPKEIDALVQTLPDNQGVYFVPALAGLGAPHWQAEAKAQLDGLTLQSDRRHIVRAALESIAYMTHDVLNAMQADARQTIQALKVDGGVTKSNFLMQFLADLLNIPVIRSKESELTAKGAGFLSGLATGFWSSPQEVAALPEPTDRFEPKMDQATRQGFLKGWRAALSKVTTPSRTGLSTDPGNSK